MCFHAQRTIRTVKNEGYYGERVRVRPLIAHTALQSADGGELGGMTVNNSTRREN